MGLKGTCDHINVQEICINECYGRKKKDFILEQRDKIK